MNQYLEEKLKQIKDNFPEIAEKEETFREQRSLSGNWDLWRTYSTEDAYCDLENKCVVYLDKVKEWSQDGGGIALTSLVNVYVNIEGGIKTGSSENHYLNSHESSDGCYERAWKKIESITVNRVKSPHYVRVWLRFGNGYSRDDSYIYLKNRWEK